jgi:TonB family protein
MFRVERLRSAGLLCITCLLLCPATSSVTQTRDPKLDELASRLASQVMTQQPRKAKKLRIVVLDFRDENENLMRLGVQLADEFTQALRAQAPELAVLDRAIVRSAMHDDCLRAYLESGSQGPYLFAKRLGAGAVVRGSFLSHLDGVDLQVGLATTDATRLAEAEQVLAWSDERRVLDSQPAYTAQADAGAEPPWSGIPSAVEVGHGVPRCLSCPNPPYTEDARKFRLQGSVLLSVLIGEDGSVRDVRVQRGLACGMTEQTIKTVKKWKFAPVLGPDGKPAVAQLTVEANFLLK